jgi:hypothetical protein
MIKRFNYLKSAYLHLSNQEKYNIFKEKYNNGISFFNKQKNVNRKKLLAIYDFIDAPYTSDIGIFIINAEIERRRNKLEKIDIVFITNDTYPANPKYQNIITKDNYKQLIYNFAIEFTRLFDFIGSILVLDNRNNAIKYINNIKDDYMLFPQDYNSGSPFERIVYKKEMSFYATNYSYIGSQDESINCLCAPKEQIRLARKWLLKNAYPKIPITITLRETLKIDLIRNSKITEWQKLIDYFKNDSRYIFIIMRDYYQMYDEDILVGDNLIYCNEAVLSLSFRAALHQLATLNLFIQNGVSVVSLLSNITRYIQFKMVTNEVGSTTMEHYKEYLRLNLNDNWYGATKYQKIIWEDDNFEVLKRETDSMLKLLEDDEKLYPDCYNKDFDYTKVEKLDIKHEVYQQPSLISQRTPLKYYVFVFKILKFIKSIFKIGKYKSIYDIDIKQNDRLVLYGAGTITKNLIQKYKDNIIGVVDKSYDTIENKMIEQISISSVESLKELTYDYIVVTPKWREYSIIDELKTKFHIRNSKFLLGSKYD